MSTGPQVGERYTLSITVVVIALVCLFGLVMKDALQSHELKQVKEEVAEIKKRLAEAEERLEAFAKLSLEDARARRTPKEGTRAITPATGIRIEPPVDLEPKR